MARPARLHPRRACPCQQVSMRHPQQGWPRHARLAAAPPGLSIHGHRHVVHIAKLDKPRPAQHLCREEGAPGVRLAAAQRRQRGAPHSQLLEGVCGSEPGAGGCGGGLDQPGRWPGRHRHSRGAQARAVGSPCAAHPSEQPQGSSPAAATTIDQRQAREGQHPPVEKTLTVTSASVGRLMKRERTTSSASVLTKHRGCPLSAGGNRRIDQSHPRLVAQGGITQMPAASKAQPRPRSHLGRWQHTRQSLQKERVLTRDAYDMAAPCRKYMCTVSGLRLTCQRNDHAARRNNLPHCASPPQKVWRPGRGGRIKGIQIPLLVQLKV